MRQGPNVRCAHAERALPGNPMLPPCPHRPGHPRPVPSDRPAGCDRKGVRVSAGRCMVREHRVTNMHVLPTHMPQYGWAQCHRKGWHVEHRAEHRPRVVDGGYASGGWEPIQSSIYRVSHGPILAVCVGYAQKPRPNQHPPLCMLQLKQTVTPHRMPRRGTGLLGHKESRCAPPRGTRGRVSIIRALALREPRGGRAFARCDRPAPIRYARVLSTGLLFVHYRWSGLPKLLSASKSGAPPSR